MAVINKNLFLSGIDRLAKSYEEFKSGIEKGNISGTMGTSFQLYSDSNDYDVEHSMIEPARGMDVNYTTSNMVLANSYFTALISALESHVRAKGYTSLEGYLSGQGIKASTSFGELYYRATGRAITDTYLQNRSVIL